MALYTTIWPYIDQYGPLLTQMAHIDPNRAPWPYIKPPGPYIQPPAPCTRPSGTLYAVWHPVRGLAPCTRSCWPPCTRSGWPPCTRSGWPPYTGRVLDGLPVPVGSWTASLTAWVRTASLTAWVRTASRTPGYLRPPGHLGTYGLPGTYGLLGTWPSYGLLVLG